MTVGSSGFGSVQPRAGILVLIAHNPEEIVQWHHGAFHCLLTRPLPQLLDRPHRLAGHPSKGADLSLQGERLGGEVPMLQGVPVALGSSATGAVHPTDATTPERPELGTVARSASIWRGISTPGA